MPKRGSGAPTSPVSGRDKSLEEAAPQPCGFLWCKTPQFACASLVLVLSCLPFLQRGQGEGAQGRLGSGLARAGLVRAGVAAALLGWGCGRVTGQAAPGNAPMHVAETRRSSAVSKLPPYSPSLGCPDLMPFVVFPTAD